VPFWIHLRKGLWFAMALNCWRDLYALSVW